MIWKNWGDYEIFRVFGFGDFDGDFDCCYNKLREIMKLLSVLCLLALCLLALSFGVVYAAPFVVSDPTLQGVTHCGYVLDGGVKVDSIVAVSPLGKSCKIDVGSAATGNHSITASFVNIDPTYGRQESIQSAPLEFTVPAKILNAPGVLRIVP